MQWGTREGCIEFDPPCNHLGREGPRAGHEIDRYVNLAAEVTHLAPVPRQDWVLAHGDVWHTQLVEGRCQNMLHRPSIAALDDIGELETRLGENSRLRRAQF